VAVLVPLSASVTTAYVPPPYIIFAGVSKVGITGDGKDRLEVEGEGVDTVLLVNYLRKKVCRSADIVKVEVKDKKDEKKPEEPPYYCWPNYYYCPPPPPPLPMVERADDSCHVM
jgi:hypothetical protein